MIENGERYWKVRRTHDRSDRSVFPPPDKLDTRPDGLYEWFATNDVHLRQEILPPRSVGEALAPMNIWVDYEPGYIGYITRWIATNVDTTISVTAGRFRCIRLDESLWKFNLTDTVRVSCVVGGYVFYSPGIGKIKEVRWVITPHSDTAIDTARWELVDYNLQ